MPSKRRGGARVNQRWLICDVGTGLLGHTMVNGLLRHLSPLIVSVTLLLEPVSGSLIGWLLGVQAVPGVWTVVQALVVRMFFGVVKG